MGQKKGAVRIGGMLDTAQAMTVLADTAIRAD